MGVTQHLVDRNGQDLAAATRDAVRDAYQWAVVEFPNLDQAAVAGWAEDLGKAMLRPIICTAGDYGGRRECY
ncbi:MAG: hypothetical protein QOE55_2210 [Acidobacteriaceae bacterium]|jgi:hypothetical protein|nr:hypothetical protein [Acidobacteriaceae bacterium]